MSNQPLPPISQASPGQYFEPPNPTWTWGQKVESTPEGKAWVDGEKEGWTVLDTATTEPLKLYRLMISGIVPRPVAFVSSISETGVENLAPFSWFNMITHDPPLVSIAIANPKGGFKDTAANIRATKQFVANIISEPFLHQANVTCIDTPHDVSEWDISGLTKAPSIHVKPPRVKESAFSMECELYEAIDITNATGAKTSTFVLGLVKKIHVRNDVLAERISEANPGDSVMLVDPLKFKPAARLGDITYGSVGALYRIGRPSWSAEKDNIAAALGGQPKEDGSGAEGRL